MSKWNDPQLDRAQFAADELHKRWEELAAKMAPISAACREGRATADQLSELEDMRERVVELIEKISGISEKVFEGNPAPHLNTVSIKE